MRKPPWGLFSLFGFNKEHTHFIMEALCLHSLTSESTQSVHQREVLAVSAARCCLLVGWGKTVFQLSVLKQPKDLHTVTTDHRGPSNHYKLNKASSLQWNVPESCYLRAWRWSASWLRQTQQCTPANVGSLPRPVFPASYGYHKDQKLHSSIHSVITGGFFC